MRSTELNAVLGLEQMKRLDSNVNARKNNLDVWLSNLDEKKYFLNFYVEGNSNFALPLIVNPEYDTNKEQFLNKICKILENEKVEYRLGTAGGGNQARQPYLKNYGYKVVGELNMSNYIHENGLYVGNHTDLTNEQIVNLCKRLNDV
jgi:CDP-6-deoxy-D-xylo-4-hexulose-3-dehydrase